MPEHLSFERIEDLIAGFLTDTLTAEERSELERWVEASMENRRLLASFSDSESLQRRIDTMRGFDVDSAWRHVGHRIWQRRLYRLAVPLGGAAALVALTIVLGQTGPFQNKAEQPTATLSQQLSDSIVWFRYASGKTVALDKTCSIELSGAHAQGDAEGLTVTSRAENSAKPAEENTVTVPAARRFDILLSDGTHVTLNAGSTLRFPDRFPVEGPREVYLQGEAYFNVSKDARHPFIVRTDERYVRVTGTEFNVNCYDPSEAQVTTLVEGSVCVGRPGAGEAFLTPGMQALQGNDGTKIGIRKVDTHEYTAWVKGLFEFRNRSLKEIMHSVERWYGCRIVFEDTSREELRFSGSIARSSSLDEIAAYFAHTEELTVTATDNTLTIR